MSVLLKKAQALYDLPFLELMEVARGVHRKHNESRDMKLCAALSIKTGNCPEDCAFCSQSAHYQTTVIPEALLALDQILTFAKNAKEAGVNSICLGAAWRNIPKGEAFERVMEIVNVVSDLGMQVCASMGGVSYEQALALKDAGCSEYNHNLDTSREFYGEIISTRTYEDRLRTLEHLQRAGLALSCGGILGMGESIEDRLKLICNVTEWNPKTVPLNALQPMPGTPLGKRDPIDPLEYVRIVAVCRVLNPEAVIAVAAGRLHMSREMQVLAFGAGANAIYVGNKILTVKLPKQDEDLVMLENLGFKLV